MRRRRRGANPIFVLIVGAGMLGLFIYLIGSLFFGGERSAKKVVKEFYHFESVGDFGQSWDLLHTEMKARFDRGSYVQDRAHVFIGHFGADTFSYEVSGAEKLTGWKMIKDGEAFATVYEFEVTQRYNGKYGHFLFVQYVYVVEEEGEWRIMWDYKK